MLHTYRALIPPGVDGGDFGVQRERVPPTYPSSFLTSFPLAMIRPPSQESTPTDVSSPDSLFSKISEVSEAESPITEPPRKSTDALAWDSHSRGGITDALPADHVCELKQRPAPPSQLADTLTLDTSQLPLILFLDLLRLVWCTCKGWLLK